jgi:hypothetical protein
MQPPNPPYEKSVFINCPYDSDFQDLFHAIVLTVSACGMSPRSALETMGQGDPRITRITETLANSKYSIHDLSRFTGEGVANLARSNMPIELGIAIALRYERRDTNRPHNFGIMAPVGSPLRQFASDLLGLDAYLHELTVHSVIRATHFWLQEQPDTPLTNPAATVFGGFDNFKQEIAARQARALGQINWADIVRAASAIVPQL